MYFCFESFIIIYDLIFMFIDILSDPNQVLFKPCGGSDGNDCKIAVIASLTSKCPLHASASLLEKFKLSDQIDENITKENVNNKEILENEETIQANDENLKTKKIEKNEELEESSTEDSDSDDSDDTDSDTNDESDSDTASDSANSNDDDDDNDEVGRNTIKNNNTEDDIQKTSEINDEIDNKETKKKIQTNDQDDSNTSTSSTNSTSNSSVTSSYTSDDATNTSHTSSSSSNSCSTSSSPTPKKTSPTVEIECKQSTVSAINETAVVDADEKSKNENIQEACENDEPKVAESQKQETKVNAEVIMDADETNFKNVTNENPLEAD